VPADASGGGSVSLPFSIRLESFEIDYYQGTRRPAMFRSHVIVEDPSRGARFPAVIQMNQELAYRGYRFFQSSYQEGQGRDQTVLAVSKDPGQPIVFLGYGLLVLGMTTVLLTRISQRRAASRLLAHTPGTLARPFAAVLGAFLVLGSLAPPRAEATEPAGGEASLADPAVVDVLRRLPVQHDGRLMPLDTLARETMLKVTGERRWQGVDPVAAVVGWASDPHSAVALPAVRIGAKALARRLGLPDGATHASFGALYGNGTFRSLIDELHAEQQAGRPVHGLLSDVSKLEDRMVWMQGFLEGSSLAVVPGAGPGDPWSPLAGGVSARALLDDAGAGHGVTPVDSAAVERELRYNRVRPTRAAWLILLGAMVLSILGWNLKRRWLDAIALVGLLAGFGVMTWGLAVRWQIAGRIPAANMYESMLFLGWGVGLFALIAFVILRNRLVILNATAMAALTMMLVDLLPIDPFIHPVPPVLSGTPWLAIHVPIIMISYSVLALGVLIAHMQVGVEIFAPSRRPLAAHLNDLLYWYLHIGSILLIAGIMTGSIWASSSWGRYWGWDPKEVWSLVAFLAYMAILHGRMDKLVGPLGVAALSIIAFLTILMTYIGVNFVLTAGLHSYGFGSSSVVTWLLLVAVLETAFIGAGFATRAWRKRTPHSIPLPTS